MKRMNILKGALCVSLAAMTGVAGAQTKALNFYVNGNNWFANYVGVRVSVSNPTGNPTVGNKQFTIANDGSGGTTQWGRALTTSPGPVIDQLISMVAVGGDTMATAPYAVGSMAGKIAFIYRGTSEFGYKASQAKLAGAVACVIVNNIPGGPVGMAAGTYGTGVTTIPVVMISKEEGDAIDAQYRAGVPIRMTITNWGAGKTNDIGFVPGGAAMWHAYAVPSNQLTSGSPTAYMAVDGAFIANYGSATATGVTLSSSLTFTPTGGSTGASLHSTTVTLPSFAVADSIVAMFDTLSTATNVYSLPAGTGKGRYDQTYTLSMTGAPDDYTGDNSVTTSFYATDSVYSKGRFDFTAVKPITTIYSGRTTAADVIWGNMYFVNKGGAAVRNVQYSFSMNSTVAGTVIDVPSTFVYLYKWVDDGDGIVQNGELQMVGLANHTYDASSPAKGDTSGATFSATEWKAVNAKAGADYVILEDNTWYFVAVQIPPTYYFGCDGVLDQYPRIYGRRYNKSGLSLHNSITTDNFLEYSNLNITGDSTIFSGSPTDNNSLMPYTQEALIAAVDSFSYEQSKGLIPAISMIVNNNPVAVDHSHDAVNNVNKTTIGATLFPNPAADYVTVTLDLNKQLSTVTYTVIDGLARIVSKEVSNNVQNEKHTINTAKLPAGNYDLIISGSDGSFITKKLTIVK